jgi:hypothetical protein
MSLLTPADGFCCDWFIYLVLVLYKNLALVVGGLSEIEAINYAHESRGT